jgi:hypothetical protein
LYQSTLADEIGHWLLQIDRASAAQGGRDDLESATAGVNSIQVGMFDRSLPEEVFLDRSLNGDNSSIFTIEVMLISSIELSFANM